MRSPVSRVGTVEFAKRLAKAADRRAARAHQRFDRDGIDRRIVEMEQRRKFEILLAERSPLCPSPAHGAEMAAISAGAILPPMFAVPCAAERHRRDDGAEVGRSQHITDTSGAAASICATCPTRAVDSLWMTMLGWRNSRSRRSQCRSVFTRGGLL